MVLNRCFVSISLVGNNDAWLTRGLAWATGGTVGMYKCALTHMLSLRRRA